MLFVVVFVVVHWHYDNLINFLWLSDIGMFGAVAALWLRSRLLASMMLLATALTDGFGWSLDFILGFLVGWHPLNATTYMFDPRVPPIVRALSLFHLLVPAMLVWMVHRLGYDRRALGAQTAFTVILFWVSHAVTNPTRNINWVFGPGQPQSYVPGWLYLVAMMTAFPVMCYVPVHLILIALRWDRRGAPPPARAGDPSEAMPKP
jgi:hypothetical protein